MNPQQTVMASLLSVAEAVDRVKSIFVEMPGTQLTAIEISRLSGLECAQCEPIVDALVTAGFLVRRRDDRFRRRSEH